MSRKGLTVSLLCCAAPLLGWAGEICSYNFENVRGREVMDCGPSGAHLKMEGFPEGGGAAAAPGGKCAVFAGGETVSGTLPLKPGDYEDLRVSFKFKSAGMDDKWQMILELGTADGLKVYLVRGKNGEDWLYASAVYSDMASLPEIKANGPWVGAAAKIDGKDGVKFQGEWRDITAFRDPKDKKLKLLIDGRLAASRDCPYPISLTNSRRDRPNWESSPLKISLGGKTYPLKGSVGDIRVSLGETPPSTPVADSRDKLTAMTLKNAAAFLNSLNWSLSVLEEAGFPMSLGQPGWSYKIRLQAAAGALSALRTKKNPAPAEAEAVWSELEMIERDMILDSIQVIQPPYTAPSRAGSLFSLSKEAMEKRLDSFNRENTEMMKDWEKAAAVLKSLGVDSGPLIETERLTALKPSPSPSPSPSAAPINRFYEQAASFYRRVAGERHSLGAGVIAAGNELDSLVKAAALRASLGAKNIDISEDTNKINKLVSAWRGACLAGNHSAALDRKKETDVLLRKVKDIIFEPSPAAPVVRPGAGFFSSGNFADGGDWQALPCSAARSACFFITAKDAFMPCSDETVNWSVSFEPSNSVLDKYEVLDTSWTHSHRLYTFKNQRTGRTAKMDCWWSFLAPGAMFDAHGPEIAFADTTMGNPAAPDKVMAVIDGKISIVRKGETFDPLKMTEGWILLIWENGMPQIPILVFFERRPEKFVWADSGLIAIKEPGVGKFAAAMLYGAQPRSAGWSKKAGVDEISAQCRAIVSRLAFFPLEIEEFYSVGADKVTVYDRVSKYIELNGDWEPARKPYITAPYLYALGLDCGAPVVFGKKLSEPLSLTLFGPFRTADGLELSYTVPRISMDQREPLKPSGEDAFTAEYNRIFRETFPDEKWRFFYEALGFGCGWCMMDGKSRDFFNCYKNPREIEGAVTGEMPMKAWGHTSLPLDINLVIDSASGKSCWMRGWRGFRHNTRLIGDHTAFNMESLAGAYSLAKYFGHWDLIQKHWPLMRRFYSSTAYRQLWGTPGQDCLSTGMIFYTDMLGDGQRANSLAASMARVVGDKDTEADAVYMGSRTAASIGILTHPNIIVYNAALKNAPAPSSPDAAVQELGFEDGGFLTKPFRPYTEKSWNSPLQSAGCAIYDYPFYGALLDYYPRTSLDWLRRYMKDIPEWADFDYRKTRSERVFNAWQILKFIACTEKDRKHTRDIFHSHFAPKGDEWRNNFKDKNFMSWVSYGNVVPHIIAQTDPLWLGEWGRAVIKTGEYDREKRAASICLSAQAPGELSITSLLKPESVTVDGAVAECPYNSARHELKVPFGAGERKIVVTLPKYDESGINYPNFAGQNTGAPLSLPKCPPPSDLKIDTLAGDIKTEKCAPVDIRAVCNMGFDDKTGADANGDSWLFPKGNTLMRGVPFEITDPDSNGGKSCVVLKGAAEKYFPEKTAPIPVGKMFKRVFFLHGFGGGGNGERGTPVLTYTLNFEDGQKRVITARAGLDIGAWKVRPGGKALPELPNARAGAHYPAGRKGQWGEGAGAYVFEWKNDVLEQTANQIADQQRGLAKLKSIEINSFGNTVPMVFAITGEE